MQQNLFELLNAPRNKREARFEQFHAENPVVYKLWDKFTREAISKGYRKIGVALIMERIRWETNIELHDQINEEKEIKINDHHKAYYARLWLKNNPQHKGMFELRTVEGDNDK